jgi:hypothetical protein
MYYDALINLGGQVPYLLLGVIVLVVAFNIWVNH